MRINERFEQLEEKIYRLEKEVEVLKAGADQTGKAETEAKAEKAAEPAKAATKAKTAAPKAKRSTSK